MERGLRLGEDSEGDMDNRRSEKCYDKEQYQQSVLAHQEYIKEASQQEKGECQHGHRHHHQPLRLEHMALDKERGERPEDGDDSQKGKSYG